MSLDAPDAATETLDPDAKLITVGGRAHVVIAVEGRPFAAVVRDLHMQYFAHVLTRAEGNKTTAARLAGLSRRTLHSYLERLSIRVRVIVESVT